MKMGVHNRSRTSETDLVPHKGTSVEVNMPIKMARPSKKKKMCI